MSSRPTGFPEIFQSRFLILVMVAILLAAGSIKTLDLAFPSPLREKALVDFDAFYAVGHMVWQGEVAGAYHYKTMFDAQAALFGTMNFLPWTYPPPFDLVVAPLAKLPQWLAYLMFVSVTFLGFICVVKRIEPQQQAFPLIATFPALLINTTCGQNGFLTALLLGNFIFLFLGHRRSAGISIGLMAIKPHLAIGAALLPVLQLRGGIVFLAILTLVLFNVAATLILGPDIWSAFVNGAKESREFLELGLYPLFRMASVYSTVFLAGANPAVAITAQGVVAIGAISTLIYCHSIKLETRSFAGIGILTSLLISPYIYDYDLPILAIALALLARDIELAASRFEQLLLIVLCWICCGSGLLIPLFETDSPATRVILSSYEAAYSEIPSYAGASLLLVAVLLTKIAIRRHAENQEAFRDPEQPRGLMG